jgi:hypothetical protein
VNLSSTIMLVAASLATATLSTGAAFAQSAPTPDGAYKGTMVCPLPGERVLRVPLDIVIAENSVQFARPILDDNGRVFGNEMGTGTVEGTSLHLKSSGHSGRARYEASYNGELTPEGGTLTGTQAWTVNAETRLRACTAAFVKIHS